MDTKKLIRIGYYALIFVVLLIAVYILISGTEDDAQVDMALTFGAILILIAAVAALGAFVYNIILNFNESKGLVIGLGVMIIVVAIGYMMATPDLLDSITNVDPTDADRSLSKWTGAGLKSTFIFGILAVLASIYFGVKNILN
jgi:hypothetical protein